MIFLATDFGLTGPYMGQMEAVIRQKAPACPIVTLFADLPSFEPQLGAYLLPAYCDLMQPGDILVAVVDPGVGSARLPLLVEADGRLFVGPDNGLFELMIRRAHKVSCREITWRPKRLSATFHGRDLFAPVAARLALGEAIASRPVEPVEYGFWPDDLPAVVYVDHYGNLLTGLRATSELKNARIEAGGRRLERVRTFADCAPGEAFWYENANGLVELACNGSSAARALGLGLKSPVYITLDG